MAKQGLSIRRLKGSEITPEMWDKFYDFYLDTVSITVLKTNYGGKESAYNGITTFIVPDSHPPSD